MNQIDLRTPLAFRAAFRFPLQTAQARREVAAYYYAPSAVLAAAGWRLGWWGLYPVAALLFLLATAAIPGYMSHYCRAFDMREIFNPFRALARVFQGGARYYQAWGIALGALALSFVGLLGLGIGFLFTSVWFWQVAGFSFATVFTNRFGLDAPAGDGGARGRLSE